MNTFSIRETYRFAWNTFTKRPWIFVGASLLILLVNILVDAFVKMFEGGAFEIFGVVVSLVSGTLIGLGMTAFYLKAHDAVESADIKQLWHPQDFWKYLGVTILNGLAVFVIFIPLIIMLVMTIGMALLSSAQPDIAAIIANFGWATLALLSVSLVAAIYVSSMLLFGTYTVVDRSMGPINALKESIKMTKGQRLHVIGYMLSLIVLNLLGALALMVGLLVTIPMSMLGFAHIYRTLSPRAPANS